MNASYVIKRGHDYIQCKQHGLALSMHWTSYKQATKYHTQEAARIMQRLFTSYLGQDMKVVRVVEHDS